MKPIATVVNNKQPGWQNAVETEPNVTLPVGTKLYLAEPFTELGAPLGGGFYAGEMTIGGELYALIVASKAEGEKLEIQYKKSDRHTADGTDSDDDGLTNSSKINDENPPAALFCQSLEIGDHKDWYLPSRDELAMLCRNLGPRRKNTPEAFCSGGTEAFEPQCYWSSTEFASYSYFAWFVSFYGGFQYYGSKLSTFGVRAVRRFKI